MPALASRRARREAEAGRAYVADRKRDVRAEERALELLHSSAGADVGDMYEQLGFVGLDAPAGDYGYLIYPHRPIVSYDTSSGELLSEYCVRFPDAQAQPDAGEWLPDADDVLAKWMALRADEERLISAANMHLPGRQHDPEMVRRDLAFLRAWRRNRSHEQKELAA
jgi:hypothetical protein